MSICLSVCLWMYMSEFKRQLLTHYFPKVVHCSFIICIFNLYHRSLTLHRHIYMAFPDQFLVQVECIPVILGTTDRWRCYLEGGQSETELCVCVQCTCLITATSANSIKHTCSRARQKQKHVNIQAPKTSPCKILS